MPPNDDDAASPLTRGRRLHLGHAAATSTPPPRPPPPAGTRRRRLHLGRGHRVISQRLPVCSEHRRPNLRLMQEMTGFEAARETRAARVVLADGEVHLSPRPAPRLWMTRQWPPASRTAAAADMVLEEICRFCLRRRSERAVSYSSWSAGGLHRCPRRLGRNGFLAKIVSYERRWMEIMAILEANC
ncbi:hypothetical protein ACQ4PT_061234 [Festuca glaucescens]